MAPERSLRQDPGDMAGSARAPRAITKVGDAPELWQQWYATRAEEARRALAEHYLPFAHAVAGRIFARRPKDGVELEECRQLAAVGLLEALGRFRPDQGAQFTTFAHARIHGAVLNGLAALTERLQQASFRRRIEADRLDSLATAPTSSATAAELLERLGEIGLGVAFGILLEGTGLAVAPEERLPEDAYARLEIRQLSQRLWAQVAALPERERRILELHYGSGRPFEAIAGDFNLSKGRISQLHRQALLSLRASMKQAERCDVTY